MVDDEPDFLLTTAMLLEDEGFAVATAASGHDALARIRQGLTPDIVLLDSRMPGLTGPECLRELRSTGLQCPAILVSAMRDLEEVRETHGFHAALRKPFQVAELVGLIRPLLDEAEG
jgi:CheY-like chemotaxis protein